MKRIRIMHAVYDFEVGGIQSVVRKLLAGLDPARFEQIVCAITSGYPPDAATRARLIALGHRPGIPVFLVPEFLKLFNRERPDVVHSHNWGTIEAIPAARMARVATVLHTEHGRDLRSLGRMPLRHRLFRKLCYGWADGVFTISEEMKRYYAAATALPEGRLQVLLNSVDTSVFRRDASARRHLRRELGLGENIFVAGCVARLDPVKDLCTLFRAAETAIAKGQDLRIVLVGDGPERAALETYARRRPGLRDRVLFMGERAEVAQWLNVFDVFVLPSHFEGISGALLEAMATGIPVVATAVGGNPEVIEHERSGLLFPRGDAETLSKYLWRLRGDAELRSTLVQNASCRVETQFSLRCMLDRYTDIYSRAVEKQPTCAGAWLRRRPQRVQEPPLLRAPAIGPAKGRDGTNAIERTTKPILVVTPVRPPDGGMAVQARKLVARLRAEGIPAELLPTNPTPPRLLSFVRSLPMLRTAVREVQFLHSLIRQLPAAHAVHHLATSQLYFFLHSIPLLLACRWSGKPILLNYRGGSAAHFLDRWRWIAGPAMRLADDIAVPSAFLQEIFEARGLKCSILPNVVDSDSFPFKQRDHFYPRLLVTRNLEVIYDVECVLRAFRIVRQAHPNAELGIAGAGREEQRLRKLAREWKLGAAVKFFGFVPHEQLPAVHAEYDILVNASRVDNFPGAITEAACSGLAIVTTRAGGIAKMIRHRENGLLVDLNDPQALAAGVLELLDNQELAQSLTRRARFWAEQFSWQEVLSLLYKFYRLPEPAPRRPGVQIASAKTVPAS